MLTTSANANPNYLATICQLGEPIKHPKADRLQIFVVEGCRVITDLFYRQGDIGVFFPLESKLNHDLLSKLNMYEDKTLNVDNTMKGYVNNKGRVRAVKLRDEPSMGLFLHIDAISGALGVPVRYVIGEEFDTWNDTLIIEKYVPKTPKKGWAGNPAGTKKNRLKQFDRMVPGQFRLHEDTTNLRKNIHKLSPTDIISITNKLHGTSWVVGNVLVKNKLKVKEKVARWLGVRVRETDHDILYSSRTVIKNKHINQNPQHYYGTDLWGDVMQYLEGKVRQGFTLYGEAVGYTKNGAPIQKSYDYGYKLPGDTYTEGENFGVYVYRITFTTPSGVKHELTWSQIKEYCNHYGIKHVPELYYGKASDWVNTIYNELHWHETLLGVLEKTYLEKDCDMCSGKVPAEGIVVRKDNLHEFEAYKLKSFRFLEKETKDLDNGVVDLETEQHEGVEHIQG